MVERKRPRAYAVSDMKLLGAVARPFTGNAYLLLILTTLIWAGNAIAGRLAVGQVSPMALTTFRWSVVVVTLALLQGRTTIGEWRKLKPFAGRIALQGAFGFTMFNAIFYWSAYHTSAVNMGVIQGVTPALVVAIGFLVYRSAVTWLQAAGLFVTLVGVACVAARGDIRTLVTLDLNVGDLGIFLASFLYAGYTVSLRDRPPVSPTTFFSAIALAAVLTSLPLVAVEIAMGSYQAPTAKGWAIIAYAGLMPSLFAQILYIRGVAMIGPSRAGLFMNLVPVFAAFLGVLLLGEVFAVYHAIALVLVLGGIWLAERGKAAP